MDVSSAAPNVVLTKVINGETFYTQASANFFNEKIKELEAELALKDTWVKHHQESAQLSFNKASDLEAQVKDLGSKLNDCAERNMKHKVSVMDLEAKLVEAELAASVEAKQADKEREKLKVAVEALETVKDKTADTNSPSWEVVNEALKTISEV